MRRRNAYLTVYLAMCLAVILSLFLTLLEGARRNGARLEAECVTDIGMQSIMAEYHRELMKQYNLFAIDSSYGTDACGKANTEAHLRRYLSMNLDYSSVFLSDFLYRDFLALDVAQVELTKLAILTDYGGAVFRSDAVDAVKADVGLGILEELQGWMQTVKVKGLGEGKEETQKKKLDGEIREWVDKYDGTKVEVKKDEWKKAGVGNPTNQLEAEKRLGLLRLVVEDEAALSANALNTDPLISKRMERGEVSHGNVEQKTYTEAQSLTERLLFQEYLLRYMGRYKKEDSKNALRYQIEYLIAGKGNDVENLKNVAYRLSALREAANAAYLMSNEVKKGEIKAVALTACTLITLPGLTPLLEAAILLAWAYAESVYDVKTLLAGGKVPLLKNDSSWHYSLSTALSGKLKDGSTEGEGLSYEDYLRILMTLTDKDVLTARAMDMVEADVRMTRGNAAFRMDGCFRTVEARIALRSAHGFQYELIRKKSYD